MMTRIDNADVKWSENKVEGEDGSRTANCLRGRLLAERMASRNAREEAEQWEIKLLEVESLLRQEEKSRNRAERKLNFLKQRLEFMNISCTADESENSSSSRTVEIEDKGSLNSGANTESQLSLWVPTRDGSTDSLELKNDGSEMGSSENSKLSRSGEDDGYYGGDSMALVPVSVVAEDGRIDPVVLDETVKEVLESLRRAKEQLRCSMERRRMMSIIKVG